MNVTHLEAVKWLAFAAMVADHVDLLLFGERLAVLDQIGRFAFPAFALCFGLGLSASGDPLQVAMRLFAPASLAQLAWVLVQPAHPANVLFAFAVFAAAVGVYRRLEGAAARCVIVACTVVVAFICEGGILGFVMMTGGYFAARFGWLSMAASALPWLALLPSPAAAAAVAAPLLASHAGRALPRHGGLLMWAYPAHLGVLLALRSFI